MYASYDIRSFLSYSPCCLTNEPNPEAIFDARMKFAASGIRHPSQA